MPLTVVKKDSMYVVTDPSGKEFGKHKTKKEAVDQIGAIEMSKKSRSGADIVAEQRIRLLSAELDAAHGTEQPPIMIMSDGTPEGTVLMLHGQLVAAKRISMYCSNDEDYPHCDLSITIEQSDDAGLIVEKTLTLRKEPPRECKVLSEKTDPKVRNRGDAVFPSTHAKVTDNKDHFPINDADQARNALARVAQFDAAPKWWAGDLKSLQATVRRAVKAKFKNINVTEANCKEGFALFFATGSFRWARGN